MQPPIENTRAPMKARASLSLITCTVKRDAQGAEKRSLEATEALRFTFWKLCFLTTGWPL